MGTIFSCGFTGDDLLDSYGDNPLSSAGENLPKSIGDDSPTSLGKLFFLDGAGKNFKLHWGFCNLPGNILILCWGILRLSGILSLFSVDGR